MKRIITLILFIHSVRAAACSTVSCKANEQYLDGGPACPQLCSTLGKECLIRTFAAVKGCFCKQGYAKASAKGPCISITDPACARQIPKEYYIPSYTSCDLRANEEYIENGPICQSTCSNLDLPCSSNDPNALASGACYCQEGFARISNSTSACVSIDTPDCQSQIPPSPISCAKKENEEYVKGGSPCQPLCSTLGLPCNIQTFAPVNACYCKNGFGRIFETGGPCVNINLPVCAHQIPPEYYVPSDESCRLKGQNQVYIDGGSPCQTICSELGKPCTIVNKQANKACYCKPGYARTEQYSQLCIPISSKECLAKAPPGFSLPTPK